MHSSHPRSTDRRREEMMRESEQPTYTHKASLTARMKKQKANPINIHR
jgi:hypothetical protein